MSPEKHEKVRVLVVDDDAAVRDFVHIVLEAEGYAVEEAADSRSAARLMQAGRTFDVLVTDLLMPEEDGVQLIMNTLSAARAGAARPKIIAMSGGGVHAGPGLYLDAASLLGADLALEKPFTDKALLEAIRKLGLG